MNVTVLTVLVVIALALALVDLYKSEFKALTSWAAVILAVVLLVPDFTKI